MTEEQKEQWIPLTRAAKMLGVRQDKLSILAKKGTIKTRKDKLDARHTLVDMTELRELFTEQGRIEE